MMWRRRFAQATARFWALAGTNEGQLIGTAIFGGGCLLGFAMFNPSGTGIPGAYVARPLLVVFGLCAWFIPVGIALVGIRLIGIEVRRG
jgi:hypothetical protein